MSEQFGHYVLEALIGRGGMGEVYRAYDTKRDRIVALKRLPKDLASDEIFQARFRRECRLVARLNEPHVIPIHDFGEINGHLFLDMRLVEGVDLSTVIANEGPMSPKLAVDIVGQVAAALQSAHMSGLVHRDIKPSNVLVTGMTADRQSVFAYLVDFGIARSETGGGGTALTSTTGTVGTLGYMAPERISGGDGDSRSDLYSLACVLYECLTGHSPFRGETFQVMYSHVNSPPPLPSAEVMGLPRALDDVIRRGLAKNPNDRFPTAGQFATAARAALVDAGVTPPPPPGPPRYPSGPINQPSGPLALPSDPTRAPSGPVSAQSGPISAQSGPISAPVARPYGPPSGPQPRPPMGPPYGPPTGPPTGPSFGPPTGRPSSSGGLLSNRRNLIPIVVAAVVVIVAVIVIVAVSNRGSGSPQANGSGSASGGSKTSPTTTTPTSPTASSTTPSSTTPSSPAVTPGWSNYSAFTKLIGSYAGDTTHAYKGATCSLQGPSALPGMIDQIECTNLTNTLVNFYIGRFSTASAVSDYGATLVARQYSKKYWTLDAQRRGLLYQAPASLGFADVTSSICAMPTYLVEFTASQSSGISTATVFTDFWTPAPFPNTTPAVCGS